MGLCFFLGNKSFSFLLFWLENSTIPLLLRNKEFLYMAAMFSMLEK